MHFHYLSLIKFNKLKKNEFFLAIISFISSIILYILISSIIMFLLTISGYALIDYKGKATGEELDRAAGVIPGIAKTNRFLVPDSNTNIAGLNTISLIKINFISENQTNTINYNVLSNINNLIISNYLSINSPSNILFFTNNTLFYCITNRYYSDFDTFISNSLLELFNTTNYLYQEITNIYTNLDVISNYFQTNLNNIYSNMDIINLNISNINYQIYELNLRLDNAEYRINNIELYMYSNIPLLTDRVQKLENEKENTNTITVANGDVYRIIDYPTTNSILVFNPETQEAYFSTNFGTGGIMFDGTNYYGLMEGSNIIFRFDENTTNLYIDAVIPFGITETNVYRGDWGDSISNKIIFIENATNYLNDKFNNIYTQTVSVGITSNDIYRGDWGDSISNRAGYNIIQHRNFYRSHNLLQNSISRDYEETGFVVGFGSGMYGWNSVNQLTNYKDIIKISPGILLRKDGTLLPFPAFTQITNIPEEVRNNVIDVDCAGGNSAIALRSDGFVKTWGNSFANTCAVPPEVQYNAVKVGIASWDLTVFYALTKNGKLYRWGKPENEVIWGGACTNNDIKRFDSVQGRIVDFSCNMGIVGIILDDGSIMFSDASGNQGDYGAYLRGEGVTNNFDPELLTIKNAVKICVGGPAGPQFSVAVLRADGSIITVGEYKPNGPSKTNCNFMYLGDKAYEAIHAITKDGSFYGWGAPGYNYIPEQFISLYPYYTNRIIDLSYGWRWGMVLISTGKKHTPAIFKHEITVEQSKYQNNVISATNVTSLDDLPSWYSSGFNYIDNKGEKYKILMKNRTPENYDGIVLDLVYDNRFYLYQIAEFIDKILPDFGGPRLIVRFKPGIYTNSTYDKLGLNFKIYKKYAQHIILTSFANESITNINNISDTQSVVFVSTVPPEGSGYTNRFVNLIRIDNFSGLLEVKNIKFCINTNYGTGIEMRYNSSVISLYNCSFIGVSNHIYEAPSGGTAHGIRMYDGSRINNPFFYSLGRNYFKKLWIAYLCWDGCRLTSFEDKITNSVIEPFYVSPNGLVQIMSTNYITPGNTNWFNNVNQGGVLIGPKGASLGF